MTRVKVPFDTQQRQKSLRYSTFERLRFQADSYHIAPLVFNGVQIEGSYLPSCFHPCPVIRTLSELEVKQILIGKV